MPRLRSRALHRLLLGLGELRAGPGREVLGDLPAAAAAFEAAAALYAGAGEPDGAAEARDSAHRVRCAALADHDARGAAARAEAALEALAEAGFPEPGPEAGPVELGRLVDGALARAAGDAAVRLVIWVGTAMARAAALRWRADPGRRSPEAEARSDRILSALRAAAAEPARLRDEVRAGLAAYGIASDPRPRPGRPGPWRRSTSRGGSAPQRPCPRPRRSPPRRASVRCCRTTRRARLCWAGRTSTCWWSCAAAWPRSPRDGGAVFEVAWATVRMLEAARYRTSDPVQQASFLAGRSDVYELAAYAAFELRRWDDLLAGMDLFKARAVVRDRLAPELGGRAAAPGERAPLSARRTALWDLLNVERRAGAGAAAPPRPSVAAVQAALGRGEAAVSWSFVADDTLVLLALDRARVHAERVKLGAAQLEALDDYVEAMGRGWVNRALGRSVTALVGAVMPPDTRAFLSGAGRLILSPHRALNLLPFHAARLDGAFLIERASVRYVPNLASLLLPWAEAGRGAAAIGVGRTAVPGFPDLPGAGAEARAVADAWEARGERAACLVDGEATLAGAAALDLGSFRVLHFAGHGTSVLGAGARGDPFASSLVLADGALDGASLSQLRLRASIVTTAACFSGQRALALPGLGRLPGDDMFGLQAALFEAGANAVVGALWRLDDAVAARVMPELHRRLAEGAPADLALQAVLRAEAARGPPGDIAPWAPLFLSSVGRAAAAPEVSHA